MAPEVAEGTPTTVAKPEPTSPKLDELKKAYAAAWQAMIGITEPLIPAARDAKLAVWKIDGEMKAEVANIEKAANEAKLLELRNERLKLNQVQLDAYYAFMTAKADKKADPAKVAELEAAYTTAREAVDNELLAKYAHSKPAKKADSPDAVASDGEPSANKQAIIDLYRGGKSHKEIEDAGYKRSTVWHVIDKAIKSGELTKH